MSKVVRRIKCPTISQKMECVENLKMLGLTPEERLDNYLRDENYWTVCILEDNSFLLSNISSCSSDLNKALYYKDWKKSMINERGTLPYSVPTMEELLDEFVQEMYDRGYDVTVSFAQTK